MSEQDKILEELQEAIRQQAEGLLRHALLWLRAEKLGIEREITFRGHAYPEAMVEVFRRIGASRKVTAEDLATQAREISRLMAASN
jgi:hypothetical protein